MGLWSGQPVAQPVEGGNQGKAEFQLIITVPLFVQNPPGWKSIPLPVYLVSSCLVRGQVGAGRCGSKIGEKSLGAFTPLSAKAVLGPCFSTGSQSYPCCFPFSSARRLWRRALEKAERRTLILPGVNAGPRTAFGGKGRKRPCKGQLAAGARKNSPGFVNPAAGTRRRRMNTFRCPRRPHEKTDDRPDEPANRDCHSHSGYIVGTAD